MRASSNKVLKVLVAVLAAVILLVPSAMMAMAWGGTLNLEVALAAILISVLVAIRMPKLKWLSAIIGSSVIAVPPFPYWSNWDIERGRHTHLFHGYSIENLPIATFAILFVVALLLFAAIYWAIGNLHTVHQSALQQRGAQDATRQSDP